MREGSVRVNPCRVTLVYGNITAARTELLVNSANGYMRHGGGVAAAIIRAAGTDVADESKWLKNDLFGGGSMDASNAHGRPSTHCWSSVLRRRLALWCKR